MITRLPRLYLDRSPGETRGVVVVAGRAERFLLEREGDATPRLGARYGGRVLEVSTRMKLARIEIGADQHAAMKLSKTGRLSQGALLQVEIIGEPARGKGALVAAGDAAASPRSGLIRPAPSLAERLAAFAPHAPIIEGDEARGQADAAEDEALAERHELLGGLSLSMEATRGLVAVDVDLEARGSPVAAAKANALAIGEAARLLRLKALSGLIVIDLLGFPTDPTPIRAAAKAAFAPDGPEVVIGPVSRFGVLELTKPRGEQPLHERLVDAGGLPTPRTLAQRMLRRMAREGLTQPGRAVLATCSPATAAALRPLVARLGPMFQVREAIGARPDDYDIVAL